MFKKFRLILSVLILTVILSPVCIKGTTGYNYDQVGSPIHSNHGMVMNNLPMTYKDLGITKPEDFKSPEGLYVFDRGSETKIYLVDSGSSKLFELNSNYKMVDEYEHFLLNPQDVREENLRKIKTNGNLLVGDRFFGVKKSHEFLNLTPDNETIIPLLFGSKYYRESQTEVRIENHGDANVHFNNGKIHITPLALGKGNIKVTLVSTSGKDLKPINIENIKKNLETLIRKEPVVKTEGLVKNDYARVNVKTTVNGEVSENYTYTNSLLKLNDQIFPDTIIRQEEGEKKSLLGKKKGDKVTVEEDFSEDTKIEAFRGKKVKFEFEILETYEGELRNTETLDDVVKRQGITNVNTWSEYENYLRSRKEESVLETFNINYSASKDLVLQNSEYPHGYLYEDLITETDVKIKFNKPRAVYRAINKTAAAEDYLYLCDTGNNQILVVDYLTKKVKKTIHVPETNEFKKVLFEPIALVTDAPGRMYVISNNVYQGIMQFSTLGDFDRFTGVNYVQLTPWERFWRLFKTEEQIKRSAAIINTTFTSMTVDDKGFIYATSIARSATTQKVSFITSVTNSLGVVKRINTSGKDVLRTNGIAAPQGDLSFLISNTQPAASGPSRLTGVTVNKYGLYSLVDSKMGKIFTYDYEGHLLYVSGKGAYGGSNTEEYDIIQNPKGIAYYGDKLLVLDKNARSLFVFEPTAISKKINQAAKLEYEGNFVAAGDVWEQVVKENANYSYAYSGIGKKYYAMKDYKKAMEYFRLGYDIHNHSRAFKILRDDKIRLFFPYVIGLIVLVPLGIFLTKKIRYFVKLKQGKVKRKDEESDTNLE